MLSGFWGLPTAPPHVMREESIRKRSVRTGASAARSIGVKRKRDRLFFMQKIWYTIEERHRPSGAGEDRKREGGLRGCCA